MGVMTFLWDLIFSYIPDFAEGLWALLTYNVTIAGYELSVVGIMAAGVGVLAIIYAFGWIRG